MICSAFEFRYSACFIPVSSARTLVGAFCWLSRASTLLNTLSVRRVLLTAVAPVFFSLIQARAASEHITATSRPWSSVVFQPLHALPCTRLSSITGCCCLYVERRPLASLTSFLILSCLPWRPHSRLRICNVRRFRTPGPPAFHQKISCCSFSLVVRPGFSSLFCLLAWGRPYFSLYFM